MSEATDQQEEQQTEEQTPEQKRIAELEASVGRLDGALKNERDAHKATKAKAQTALSEEDQAEFERLRQEGAGAQRPRNDPDGQGQRDSRRAFQ